MIFELPILVYFLTKIGLVTPEFMKKYRRHSLVVILVLAAIITPPDVFSQILVSLPLIALYEVGIVISRRIVKTTGKRGKGKGKRRKYKLKDPLSSYMKLYTQNLVKQYRSRTVVKNVSIEVERGEIVGLLGPNGAGKTTSFYMIVGLITPNEGKIFLDDVDITREPVYKRARKGIGYLAQEASVFRKLSIENNIKAVLEMSGMSREEQQERLENLLKNSDFRKIRRSLGIQLSGGERRRTEIARALALNPNFILLDEPFAGVDPLRWRIFKISSLG